MSTTPVLEIKGLSKIYPPSVVAIERVDMSVHAGEIRGLVGMNGAGKSTIIKILSGVVQPSGGEIVLSGQSGVTLDAPADAARAGIGVVHQELPLLGNLTAAENVALGAGEGGTLSPARRARHERHYAEVARRLPGAPRADTVLGTLDIDGWQMVALVRALSSGAKVLILDEPTSSLNATERESLHASLRALSAEGVAIVYVSHFLDDILEMCDYVTVMRDGRVCSDRAVEGLDARSLLTLMTGEELAADAEVGARSESATSNVRLEVTGLISSDAGPIDFSVAAGECVGLYGLRGCGATETVEALFGLRPARGSVRWDGEDLDGPPRARMQRGLSFISGNRSKTLFKDWSVGRNHGLPSLRAQRTLARVDDRAADRAAGESVRRFEVVGTVDRPIGTLSGGNQQKIAVGRSMGAQLIISDEPTRGVDAKARLLIHQGLRQAAESGASLVIHSTEAEELVAICDRVLVLDSGRVVDERSGPRLTVESLEAATTLTAVNPVPGPAQQSARLEGAP